MAVEQATQYSALGFRTLFISHMVDSDRHMHTTKEGPSSSRGAPMVYCHSKANVLITNHLCYDSEVFNTEVIIINQSQFFDNLVKFVKRCIKSGKIVQVYGLSSNHKMQKFGDTIDLIPLADTFRQLTAKCPLCREERPNLPPGEAAFTRCEKMLSDEHLPGMNDYASVCRQHHRR